MQITDNLSEEDIISGAVVRYCSLDIYEAIRKDREQDKRKGKAEKWKAKLAHCKWVACWRVLRRSDNFSRAANITDDLSVDVDDSSDEDAESGSKSSPSTRNKGYPRRPCGIKAAKLMRSENAGTEREAKVSTTGCGQADGGAERAHRAVIFRLSCNVQHPGGGLVSSRCDAEDDGKCRPAGETCAAYPTKAYPTKACQDQACDGYPRCRGRRRRGRPGRLRNPC